MRTIKWKFSRTNHLIVPLVINEKKLLFILDTGAQITVIDLGVVKSLELPFKAVKQAGVGVGSSSVKAYKIGRVKIKIKGVDVETNQAIAMDLSHVNYAMKSKGAKVIHGVIGNDLFRKYAAKIDFKEKTLSLRFVLPLAVLLFFVFSSCGPDAGEQAKEVAKVRADSVREQSVLDSLFEDGQRKMKEAPGVKN